MPPINRYSVYTLFERRIAADPDGVAKLALIREEIDAACERVRDGWEAKGESRDKGILPHAGILKEVYTRHGMLSKSEEKLLYEKRTGRPFPETKRERHHRTGVDAVAKRWRIALEKLPGDSPLGVADFTWVFHLLPTLSSLEKDANGLPILRSHHIENAPSRGAVGLLFDAMKDPAEYYKAVRQIVKTSASKAEKKPQETESEMVKRSDPGLEGLYKLQAGMVG